MKILPNSEKALDLFLKKEVAKLGGLCIKLETKHHKGLPDRMVLLPLGKIMYIELKSKGCLPTGLQKFTMSQISDLGFRVYVLTGGEPVNRVSEILKEC
jgi:hypothetical protein